MPYTKLSADDFIKKFNNPGKPVEIEGEYEVDGEVSFNATNYDCESVVIGKIKFNASVSFIDLKY